MRTKESLAYAIDLGVDYVGFIVDYPKSKRSIPLSKFLQTVEWLKKNKKGTYKIVAVTVDMPLQNIQLIAGSNYVDVVQLHGNETAGFASKIKGVEVWKAWNNKSKGDIIKMSKHVNRMLLDSGDAEAKAKNNSGEFDAFSLYKKLENKKVKVVLSGGIDVKNVAGYLKKLNPDIIDISRGIETAPGKKSKMKMKKFIKTVNDYYSA